MNAILGTLRGAGFSAGETDLAYHALESHIAGFTLWAGQFKVTAQELPDLAAGFLEEIGTGDYPYVVEHVHEHLKERQPEDVGAFAFGLDLILDGLERIRDAA
jgi:hypothetical protein